MCQFFLFCQTSINVIKNMEISLASETRQTTNWFSKVPRLHLLMTYMLLLNIILIIRKPHANWQNTLKEALLHKFLWSEHPLCASVCLFWSCPGDCSVLQTPKCCSTTDAIGRCWVRSCNLLTHKYQMGCSTSSYLMKILWPWENYTFLIHWTQCVCCIL